MNTISNGLKECARAVKYAYVIAVLNVNQQSNVREHHKHERMRAHEHGAFDTPPHFAYSWGTEAKCFFHAMRENFAFFKGLRAVWPACVVRCRE